MAGRRTRVRAPAIHAANQTRRGSPRRRPKGTYLPPWFRGTLTVTVPVERLPEASVQATVIV